MTRYDVYAIVHATRYIGTFEAASPEEAKQLARESDFSAVRICEEFLERCADAEINGLIVEVLGEPLTS